MNHKPFLIHALSGQGGNGLLLRQNIFRQRLQLGDVVVHLQRAYSHGGEQRQRDGKTN